MEKISTRVFLNYRREDTSDYAERLAQALTEQFGATNVFRDVASIQPGENFPAAIERAVVSSDVVLALIGKLQSDNVPSPALLERGFSRFPGRIIPLSINHSPTARDIAPIAK